MGCGDAAAATRKFRKDGPRRRGRSAETGARRGCDAENPRRRAHTPQVDEKDDLGRGQGTISMDDWTWGEVKDGKLSRDNADLKWFDNQLCASVFANCDTETGGIYMSMGTECRQSATVPIVFFGPETAIGGNGRMGACNIFEPTDPTKRPDYGDDVVYDPKGNYSITVLVTGKFPCDPPLVHNKKSDGASATTASLVVGALALVLALA